MSILICEWCFDQPWEVPAQIHGFQFRMAGSTILNIVYGFESEPTSLFFRLHSTSVSFNSKRRTRSMDSSEWAPSKYNEKDGFCRRSSRRHFPNSWVPLLPSSFGIILIHAFLITVSSLPQSLFGMQFANDLKRMRQILSDVLQLPYEVVRKDMVCKLYACYSAVIWIDERL